MSVRTASRQQSAEGTIRVYVPGPADDDARKMARRLAQREHGFGSVGKTPNAVKSGRGHTWTFSPVTVVRPADRPKVAPKVAPTVAETTPMGVAADLLANLPESVQLALVALVGGQAPAPAASPKAPKVEPEACEACKGYGVVRARGAKAGKPFVTANGAATAPNATQCTACHGPRVAATA